METIRHLPSARVVLACWTFVLLALLGTRVSAADGVALTCRAETGAARHTLVELFTSEGCNSCPPADRWLSGLAARDDLVALAFHVDYWDRLGWTDRFASPRYTQRQHQRASQARSGYVYTPQVLVNGRDFRQWAAHPGGEGLGSTASASVRLRLSVAAERGGQSVRLDVEPTRSSSELQRLRAVAWIAAVDDGLSTAVATGENAGKTLRHDRVVRGWYGPFALDVAGRLSVTQRIDGADQLPSRQRVVALVEATDGSYLQAVQVACAMR